MEADAAIVTFKGNFQRAASAGVNRAFMNKAVSLFVVLLMLLGMIAIEPAEARRRGHCHVGGGRSVMRGAGRMSRVLSRSLLGGRRGHGGRQHRNKYQNNLAGQNPAYPNPAYQNSAHPNAAYPNGIDPNAVNGAYNNGNQIGN